VNRSKQPPSAAPLACTAVARAAMAGAALLLAASPAGAAAYYVGEIGARSVARGGANLVRPDDPSAAWLNPAAITLASGLQLNIDLNLVFLTSSFIRDCGGLPDGCAPSGPVTREYQGLDGSARRYEVGGERPPPSDNVGPAEPGALGNLGTPSRFDGNTAITNRAGVQPIPRMMLSFNADTIGLDGVALAAYVFAPNNGDYNFGEDTPTRYTLIDRDLLEVYYGLAVGYRFGDLIAVGAGLQFVTAGLNQSVRLSADQYGNEDPNFDIQVRVQGQQDFIPTGNFGVWSNPGKLLGIGDLELGGSIQLGRSVRARGPIRIESLGEGMQGLIDDGLVSLDVADDAEATAEFRLAPFYRLGARYGIDDLLQDGARTIGFNVETGFVYEQWSQYDHVFLATRGVTVNFQPNDPTRATELDPVVQPKDWIDAWSVRLGGTLALWDRALELHAGGFYETSAIPNETYSVELVCGEKVGVGAGVSARMWGVRLDVGYGHVFVFDRTVGAESIVFNGNSGPSIFASGETRTKVAMGRYSAGFDMINVGLTVGFDELFGFGRNR
jgi:long-subunit fatty acid transport protein